MLRLIPLLIIPVIFYNLIALGGGVIAHHDIQDLLSADHGVTIHMFSRDYWKFGFGAMVILVSLMLLFVKVVKSTRTTSRDIVNHGSSLVPFSIALIAFIVLKGCATTPFFFIVAMTVFDVVAGYTISIVAAEHD